MQFTVDFKLTLNIVKNSHTKLVFFQNELGS